MTRRFRVEIEIAVPAPQSEFVARPLSWADLSSSSRGHCVRSFTLLELLAVVAIIGILTALVVPAFTHLTNANGITNAAYTIKEVLEQARNQASIDNTYTWVGFFEENGAIAPTNPATAGLGRLVVCAVASKDGTIVYAQPVVSPATPMDPTRLIQVSKLVSLENVHLRTFPNGTGAGDDTFPNRPPVSGISPNNAKIGDLSPAASLRPFPYPVGSSSTSPQYTFQKMIEFSPQTECRVNNNNYVIRPVIEVGFQPMHGTIADEKKDCAIQLTGFGGNIRIYQP